jgi:hypothetical protein
MAGIVVGHARDGDSASKQPGQFGQGFEVRALRHSLAILSILD